MANKEKMTDETKLLQQLLTDWYNQHNHSDFLFEEISKQENYSQKLVEMGKCTESTNPEEKKEQIVSKASLINFYNSTHESYPKTPKIKDNIAKEIIRKQNQEGEKVYYEGWKDYLDTQKEREKSEETIEEPITEPTPIINKKEENATPVIRIPLVYFYKSWHFLLPDKFFFHKSFKPYLTLTGRVNTAKTIKTNLEKYISIIPSTTILLLWKSKNLKNTQHNSYDELLFKGLDNLIENQSFQDLLMIWKTIFYQKADTKYFLFEAEAGMGKTLTMQKICVAISKIGMAKAVGFVYCGYDTDEQIKQIQDQLKQKNISEADAVIFIDAFDEDAKARKLDNREKRFEQVTHKLYQFKKVFISVRKESLISDKEAYSFPPTKIVLNFI